MSRVDLIDRYFDWLKKLVSNDHRAKRGSYRKLFVKLFDTDFVYFMDSDGNRAEDGTDLRYRFSVERKIDYRIMDDVLNDKPCSVLEMMVALAIRCEDVMSDLVYGDRTAYWFWGMVENLNLLQLRDSAFDEVEFDNVIARFHEHRYSPNGEGGLFTVRHPRNDMRDTDIWYQKSWYLAELLDYK